MAMPSFPYAVPALRLYHGPDSLSQLGGELDPIRGNPRPVREASEFRHVLEAAW